MVHGNRKFDIETELKICSDYKSGESATVLAKRYGCSSDGVRLILKRHGYKTRPLKKTTQNQEKQIAKLYIEGKSSTKIAKDFNCSKKTILSILKRQGVEMRNDRRRFDEQHEQKICNQYEEEEKSIDELGKIYKCAPAQIWRILKRRGAKTRTSGESRKEKSWKLSKSEISKICSLYQQGKNSSQLATTFNVDPTTIIHILEWNGVNRRDISVALGGARPEDYQEIVSRYNNGSNIGEVSKLFNLGSDAIRTALMRSGVHIRDQREANGGVPRELHKELCQRYQNGETGIELMKAYGVQTPNSIYSILKSNNIERRSDSGFTDSVEDAITGTNNFEKTRETSFYIYTIKNQQNLLKLGIAFDVKTRAASSQGLYENLVFQKIFPDRLSAFFFEQAALNMTQDRESFPIEMADINWAGITEVRKMEEQELISIVNFLDSEFEELTPWSFAAYYVPMTDEQREICKSR
jgi:Mor family transcriptional regulator